MATLSKGHTFSGGETVTATKLNDLVDSATISNIVNADINASAAIALSKLATDALPTGITVASANLVDGTIVNADINASAAIAATKLASDSITDTQIKSDAAIAGTKIAPAFGAQDITLGSGNRSISTTTNHALAFGTNNAERMRINNDGRVVIGHNAPVSVTGSLGFEGLQVHGLGSVPSTTFSRWTNDTGGINMSFVKSRSGTVGTLGGAVASGNTIGNITWRGDDGTGSVVAAQISAQVDGTPGTNDMPGRLVFSTTADGGSSPTERMRINSSGEVLIGTTTALDTQSGSADGFTFNDSNLSASTNGASVMFLRRRSSNGAIVTFRRDTTTVGTISVNTTATAYNTSSDYRLKENATPLIGGLATIDQLQPCQFTWKSDGSIGRGFIAHELQAVVPESVTGEKDAVNADGSPEYQGVDAAKLVPYLVSAVQELKARVEALEAA